MIPTQQGSWLNFGGIKGLKLSESALPVIFYRSLSFRNMATSHTGYSRQPPEEQIIILHQTHNVTEARQL